jgi:thymidylate synthase
MKQYLDLVRSILDTGTWQENRTGIRTISMPGAMLRFDLQQGFPAVTTKKLAFKSAIGELVGFLRASRSAADFRDLGCKVWDANANQNPQWLANPYREGPDDLGDVYGVQWRKWPAYKVLDASASARIEDATGRGYRVITEFEEDGSRKVLLYKAIDHAEPRRPPHSVSCVEPCGAGGDRAAGVPPAVSVPAERSAPGNLPVPVHSQQ